MTTINGINLFSESPGATNPNTSLVPDPDLQQEVNNAFYVNNMLHKYADKWSESQKSKILFTIFFDTL